ncbi:MAG TPA: hypothetical protein VG368_03855, partial [Acidimicrobiales bacterium]|nr:hypothetical protein [Acidimicrobiales bacterium]
VQFHPEVTPDVIERWLREDPIAVASVGGDLGEILAATSAQLEGARRRCHALVDAFLDRVASAPLLGTGASGDVIGRVSSTAVPRRRRA